MKKHGSVKITRRMLLNDLFACYSGIADIAKFLPATLYTNVEKNIPLALELADAPCAHRGADRTWWLMYELRAESSAGALPDDCDGLLAAPHERASPAACTQLDAFIIAQWLAWSADALLTKKGK